MRRSLLMVLCITLVGLVVPAAAGAATPRVGHIGLSPSSGDNLSIDLWITQNDQGASTSWAPWSDPTHASNLDGKFNFWYRPVGQGWWNGWGSQPHTDPAAFWNVSFPVSGALAAYEWLAEPKWWDDQTSEWIETSVPASGYGAFVTPPDSDDDFVVGVYGDMNTGSHVVVSSPTATNAFTAVLDALHGGTVDADVAFCLGDMLRDTAESNDETCRDHARQYFVAEDPHLGLYRTIWRCYGDNDWGDDGTPESERRDLFRDLWPSFGYDFYYSRAIGDVTFVVLNNRNWDYDGQIGYFGEDDTTTGDGDPANTTQGQWLQDTLESLTSDGTADANIVVVSHRPFVNGKYDKPYSGYHIVSAWDPVDQRDEWVFQADTTIDTNGEKEREALLDLFAKHGVDLLLCGDIHAYKRTDITVTKSNTNYTIPQICCGPAWSSWRDHGDQGTALPPAVYNGDKVPPLGANEIGVDDSDFADSERMALKLTRLASGDQWQVKPYKISTSSTTEVGAAYNETFSAVPSGCTH